MSIICLIFQFISNKEKSESTPLSKRICLKVCCEAENKYKKQKDFSQRSASVPYHLYSSVTQFSVRHHKNIFSCLNIHMYDTGVKDNHVHKLIKLISQCYCTIRLYHVSKSVNEEAVGTKIREELSRLIVFKHQ